MATIERGKAGREGDRNFSSSWPPSRDFRPLSLVPVNRPVTPRFKQGTRVSTGVIVQFLDNGPPCRPFDTRGFKGRRSPWKRSR